MKIADLIRLLLLATIWGASFLFMRKAAPEFGPLGLILIRVGAAAIVLGPIILLSGKAKEMRIRWADFSFLSLVAASAPFCLLAYSTLSLEAGFTSLINATTPIFTAIVAMVWLGQRFTRSQYLGLVLGFIGVGVLSWDRLSFKEGGDGWAIVAALAASFCYGIAGNFTRHRMQDLPPRVVAAGNTVAATIMMLPMGLWHWPEKSPSTEAWVYALLLAVVCTAVAYLLFFKIISSASAMATSTVTFLIPISAIFWGYLFLNERFTLRMAAGMAISFLGTAMVIELIGRSKEEQPTTGHNGKEIEQNLE
ncbi:MAG: DMT family transporter [Limisphaerales bacterium]